jgi:hypothetical protein
MNFSVYLSEIASWSKESDSPEEECQSKSNPEKREENTRGIFFLHQDKKKKK